MNADFVTKPVVAAFQRTMSNRHTSIAAIVYVGSIVLTRLGKVWLPSHAAQFDSTEEIIKGAAVAYGFLMAGDSKPQEKT